VGPLKLVVSRDIIASAFRVASPLFEQNLVPDNTVIL